MTAQEAEQSKKLANQHLYDLSTLQCKLSSVHYIHYIRETFSYTFCVALLIDLSLGLVWKPVQFWLRVSDSDIIMSLSLSLSHSEFPPILNETERVDYKREFDHNLMEYKRLQAELDDINQGLADVDRELDSLQEGSPQFLVSENWKKLIQKLLCVKVIHFVLTRETKDTLFCKSYFKGYV